VDDVGGTDGLGVLGRDEVPDGGASANAPARGGRVVEVANALVCPTLPAPGSCVDVVALGPGQRRWLEVLVADDEPAVLRLLDVALRQHGFAVRRAGGGEAAVELYRRHRATIDVVLLDVQMPGLDGPGALAALRAIDPAVRCVFMSGHTGRYAVEELLATGASCVLAKPFPRMDGVVQVLRAVGRP
jgi:CheY-like chemotaxis protein